MKKVILILSIAYYCLSCASIVPKMMKKKQASTTRTAAAIAADDYFWKHFHEGNYDSIPTILVQLKEAYIENPRDVKTVAHIGFTHAWAGSERIRIKNLRGNIIDHYDLAIKYFKEAYELDPKDVRLLGFHGDFMMAAGDIAGNERQVVEGYFNAKKVSKIWPEWGDFTLSYVLGMNDYEDKRFQEAIDLMWHNLDVCACEKVDRENLDWTKYYALLETDLKEKNKRACWNTWIAPHNLEGFFIHFGDLLVKSGDFKKGIMMYQNAKTTPEYKNYSYKDLLEARIKNAERNIQLFRNYTQGQPNDSNRVLMVDGKASCMGCHQKKAYVPIKKATSYVAPHLLEAALK